MARYDGSLTYWDNELNELLTTLEDRGVLRDTFVVITSDHGEMFGEHGLYGHGKSLTEPVIHVPLILKTPGRGGFGSVWKNHSRSPPPPRSTSPCARAF